MVNTPARDHRERQKQEELDRDARAKLVNKELEFTLSCDGGSVGACTSLGEWHALMRRDFSKAAKLYYPACFEKGYAQACLLLGKVLVTGRPGVSPDLKIATSAFELGCEGGNAEACFLSGSLALTRAAEQLGGKTALTRATATPTEGPLRGQAAAASAAAGASALDGPRETTTTTTTAAAATSAAKGVSPAVARWPGGGGDEGDDAGLPSSTSSRSLHPVATTAGTTDAAVEAARGALRHSEQLLLQGCWGKSLETAAMGPSCYLLASLRLDPRFAPLLGGGQQQQGPVDGSPAALTDDHDPVDSLPRRVVTMSGRMLDGDESAAARDPIENLRRGCSAESEKACRALAFLSRSGSDPRLPQNLPAARRFMHKYLVLKGAAASAADRKLDKAGW